LEESDPEDILHLKFIYGLLPHNKTMLELFPIFSLDDDFQLAFEAKVPQAN
jgi:hypothetical protein